MVAWGERRARRRVSKTNPTGTSGSTVWIERRGETFCGLMCFRGNFPSYENTSCHRLSRRIRCALARVAEPRNLGPVAGGKRIFRDSYSGLRTGRRSTEPAGGCGGRDKRERNAVVAISAGGVIGRWPALEAVPVGARRFVRRQSVCRRGPRGVRDSERRRKREDRESLPSGFCIRAYLRRGSGRARCPNDRRRSGCRAPRGADGEGRGFPGEW